MTVIYRKYCPGEEIPVYDFVKKRKLVKYYTRETMAAVVCAGTLLRDKNIESSTPFFYSTADTEMMDFYKQACEVFSDSNKPFSSLEFIQTAVPSISPLSHFKMMRNMVHCFISIEHDLKGANAALLGSASGLLYSALLAETTGTVLIGAGKLHFDDTAEAGFALLTTSELTGHPMLDSREDAIAFFRENQNTSL